MVSEKQQQHASPRIALSLGILAWPQNSETQMTEEVPPQAEEGTCILIDANGILSSFEDETVGQLL